jgi:hypothetical protein
MALAGCTNRAIEDARSAVARERTMMKLCEYQLTRTKSNWRRMGVVGCWEAG